jgi:hypothetical protein
MLTIAEINMSRPVLILYSAGTGGEFITSLLAEVSDEFNPIGSAARNKKTNRTNVNCVLEYSALWTSLTNPKTWVSSHVDKTMIGSKRYLIKDHPNVLSNCYKKHLPNVTVLHFVAKENFEYFAKLAFAKLQKKIQLSEITLDYMINNITPAAYEDLFLSVYNWASKYTWVWQHELQTITQAFMSANTIVLNSYEHNDSLQKYIDEHVTHIKKESNASGELALSFAWFENYKTIDITDINSSRNMWKQISKVINITDIESAIRKTDAWQKRNRRLIEYGL